MPKNPNPRYYADQGRKDQALAEYRLVVPASWARNVLEPMLDAWDDLQAQEGVCTPSAFELLTGSLQGYGGQFVIPNRAEQLGMVLISGYLAWRTDPVAQHKALMCAGLEHLHSHLDA